jgi:23S rRNA (cytidine1920-2'-O)/16S rRNA (cytidine1409-2'-O)-methyltransferase
MAVSKKRIDLMVVEKGFTQSRHRAQALIMAGRIFVNDQVVDKPGFFVSETDTIVFKQDDVPYVSRGGIKLEEALNVYGLDVDNFICLDVGASTGGFTDCLLHHGAKKIYAIDVGYGQIAWKLRQDNRVVVIEKTNIRHMDPGVIPCPVDLVTIDVSFISLKIVVPSVLQFMKKGAHIIALIKPQFEVGKGKVGKGGIVRDPSLYDEVITDLTLFFLKTGLKCESVIPSPILGAKGNKEFIALMLYS